MNAIHYLKKFGLWPKKYAVRRIGRYVGEIHCATLHSAGLNVAIASNEGVKALPVDFNATDKPIEYLLPTGIDPCAQVRQLSFHPKSLALAVGIDSTEKVCVFSPQPTNPKVYAASYVNPRIYFGAEGLFFVTDEQIRFIAEQHTVVSHKLDTVCQEFVVHGTNVYLVDNYAVLRMYDAITNVLSANKYPNLHTSALVEYDPHTDMVVTARAIEKDLQYALDWYPVSEFTVSDNMLRKAKTVSGFPSIISRIKISPRFADVVALITLRYEEAQKSNDTTAGYQPVYVLEVYDTSGSHPIRLFEDRFVQPVQDLFFSNQVIGVVTKNEMRTYMVYK